MIIQRRLLIEGSINENDFLVLFDITVALTFVGKN